MQLSNDTTFPLPPNPSKTMAATLVKSSFANTAAISASKSSFSRPGVGRSNLVMTARNTT